MWYHRNAEKIAYQGEERTINDWADRFGIPAETLRSRYKKFCAGTMTIEDVFTVGKIQSRRLLMIEYRGRKYTVAGLSEILGVSTQALQARIRLIRKNKMKPEKLFAKGTISQKDRDFDGGKRYILKDGTYVSLRELAIMGGVAHATIKRMYRMGKSVDEIVDWINDPYRRTRSNCWIGGKKQTFSDVGKTLGIGTGAISARIRKCGWSFQEAVSEPRVIPIERNRRSHISRKRNNRIAELKRMGVAV